MDFAIALMMAGEHEAALRELREAESAPGAAAVAAVIHARSGNVENAGRFLDAAEAQPGAARNGYGIAAVHLTLGDRRS